MHFLGRWLVPMSLAVVGCLIAAGPAPAQGQKKKADPPRLVDDKQGNLFSPEAERKANEIIAEIKAKHHKDYYVETFKTIPEAYQGKGLADKWAADRFNQLNVDG